MVSGRRTRTRSSTQSRHRLIVTGAVRSHRLWRALGGQHRFGLARPGGRGGTGRGTVTARRFRHTVGTQLAERGAKLHTIMKVLGHSSVPMALVYAQIGDQEVLRDYKAVRNSAPTSPTLPRKS